jgi:hypothetical protein
LIEHDACGILGPLAATICVQFGIHPPATQPRRGWVPRADTRPVPVTQNHPTLHTHVQPLPQRGDGQIIRLRVNAVDPGTPRPTRTAGICPTAPAYVVDHQQEWLRHRDATGTHLLLGIGHLTALEYAVRLRPNHARSGRCCCCWARQHYLVAQPAVLGGGRAAASTTPAAICAQCRRQHPRAPDQRLRHQHAARTAPPRSAAAKSEARNRSARLRAPPLRPAPAQGTRVHETARSGGGAASRDDGAA